MTIAEITSKRESDTTLTEKKYNRIGVQVSGKGVVRNKRKYSRNITDRILNNLVRLKLVEKELKQVPDTEKRVGIGKSRYYIKLSELGKDIFNLDSKTAKKEAVFF